MALIWFSFFFCPFTLCFGGLYIHICIHNGVLFTYFLPYHTRRDYWNGYTAWVNGLMEQDIKREKERWHSIRNLDVLMGRHYRTAFDSQHANLSKNQTEEAAKGRQRLGHRTVMPSGSHILGH
ncbi:hypothetical protein V8F06_004662 [Rhypophila decipiens]